MDLDAVKCMLHDMTCMLHKQCDIVENLNFALGLSRYTFTHLIMSWTQQHCKEVGDIKC